MPHVHFAHRLCLPNGTVMRSEAPSRFWGSVRRAMEPEGNSGNPKLAVSWAGAGSPRAPWVAGSETQESGGPAPESLGSAGGRVGTERAVGSSSALWRRECKKALPRGWSRGAEQVLGQMEGGGCRYSGPDHGPDREGQVIGQGNGEGRTPCLLLQRRGSPRPKGPPADGAWHACPGSPQPHPAL